MKNSVLIAVLSLGLNAMAFAPVENVQALPSSNGDGLVAITFDLRSPSAQTEVTVSVTDNTTGKPISVKTLLMADKSKATNPLNMESGLKRKIWWDARSDLGSGFYSAAMSVTVKAVVPTAKEDGLYCVIDISGGATASWYPVTYMDEMPSGGWTDEYKTTKIVLRKINAGGFKIYEWDYTLEPPEEKLVDQFVLSKPFYIGVFPITIAQYERIVGYCQNASFPMVAAYASYVQIRGGRLGMNNNSAVDGNSFLGKIRARTGLKLDLPTTAQLTYATRDGRAPETIGGLFGIYANYLGTAEYDYGEWYADRVYEWYLRGTDPEWLPIYIASNLNDANDRMRSGDRYACYPDETDGTKFRLAFTLE